MSAGSMVVCAKLAKNGYAELVRGDIKYWPGYGVTAWEGPLEGFKIDYPEVFAELLRKGFVKEV